MPHQYCQDLAYHNILMNDKIIQVAGFIIHQKCIKHNFTFKYLKYIQYSYHILDAYTF